MEPLDLTSRPPRGARETILGAMFLPRTIDKLRAELPGGAMGRYLNEPRGISSYVLYQLRIPMDELRAVVANARDEDEVVAWLRERLDPARVEETNRKLSVLGVDRLSPEDLALVRERHPVMGQRPELVRFLDIFEADDAATFGATPSP
jgi:Domain of unknown function (DUF5069)